MTPPNVDKDREQQELSFSAGGNTKWYNNFERQLVRVLLKRILLVYDPAPWNLPKTAENVCLHKWMFAATFVTIAKT